jgi:cytochrome c oxidase assembly protein subunit 15
MLIGLLSIALAAIAWRTEPRGWVRFLATGVLLAVIVQGILGGTRVLADDPRLALLHGGFAAWVFVLMAAVALVTSRSWFGSRIPQISGGRDQQPEFWGIRLQRLKPLALITPVLIFAQYTLGGMLRHLGMALHEHLGLALLVLLFVAATAVSAHRSGIAWLRNAGWLLFGVTLTQAVLGAGAWVTRFGFASAGYVGGQHPAVQVAFRSAHTVCGMLVLMAAVLYAIRVFRLSFLTAGYVEHPEGVKQQSPGSPSEREAHRGYGPARNMNSDGVPQSAYAIRTTTLCEITTVCNPYRVDGLTAAVSQGALRCATRLEALISHRVGVKKQGGAR